MNHSIVVLGAGVIGLTSAIRLQESGYSVTILARERTPFTTSDIAPAYWRPHGETPGSRESDWLWRSLAALRELAGVEESGVSFKRLDELYDRPAPEPEWKNRVDGFERPDLSKMPEACVDGYRFNVPLMDTTVYMPYLERRFQERGGVFEAREFRSLDAVTESLDLAVHCAGLGARASVGDEDVRPVRGQVLRVRKPDELPETIQYLEAGGEVTYIAPRQSDCLLGGTRQMGDWEFRSRDEETREIFNRCVELQPCLKRAELLEAKVGLRPYRASIRLEAETLSNGTRCVHNYGHGARGHSLAWGCADAARDLIGAWTGQPKG